MEGGMNPFARRCIQCGRVFVAKKLYDWVCSQCLDRMIPDERDQMHRREIDEVVQGTHEVLYRAVSDVQVLALELEERVKKLESMTSGSSCTSSS